jgi:hypothetical protein
MTLPVSVSCGNCNASRVEIEDIEITIPTVFGSIDVEMSLCKTCKSGIEFCQLTMIECYEFLLEKMSSRAKQLNCKLQRNLV